MYVGVKTRGRERSATCGGNFWWRRGGPQRRREDEETVMWCAQRKCYLRPVMMLVG